MLAYVHVNDQYNAIKFPLNSQGIMIWCGISRKKLQVLKSLITKLLAEILIEIEELLLRLQNFPYSKNTIFLYMIMLWHTNRRG